ncbi:hypothetical protein DCO58_03860 [Helicobacter saguini]|uniref:Toxin-antitoxin system YwqK family antitoxin n=1 Tax=Helicobacter saguini TaxID=1548018 RepID=A0A347VSH6_9HELI|nr:hypothetical protein [Helicobacter saguini]MWV62503.1 hypothetical protein [Helicobacter saguini]MWV66824.1 hypothetical protein [Helicobacter saguini]MWV69174.1 hypothetical protein [Helicobacter saguini]MWV71271.1 hypothetical protein [Helicobacter saguini]TLD94213.1 hypothetical protein LS64_006875 [Helicobacter saguini]
MKKTLPLLIVIALTIFIGYKITHEIDEDELHLYENFNDKNELISQVEYLTDSNHKFIVCASRDGQMPCKEIEGLRHGFSKWYKDGVLEYVDIFNHGKLEKSTLFYKNGLKNHESIFQHGRVIKENFYADSPSNEITQSIIHKNNETIKKYYKNNKVQVEEKYRNNKLVSRKIYNDEGVMERLEEYGGFGNGDPFNNFMDDFDTFEKEFEYEELPNQFDKNGMWI